MQEVSSAFQCCGESVLTLPDAAPAFFFWRMFSASFPKIPSLANTTLQILFLRPTKLFLLIPTHISSTNTQSLQQHLKHHEYPNHTQSLTLYIIRNHGSSYR